MGKKYGVTFDMFHKINVNGANAIPLYKWLKEKLPGTITNAIKWNFTKFLSDRNGVPYKRYAPNFAPNDIIPDIEKLLAQEASNEESFISSDMLPNIFLVQPNFISVATFRNL